MMKNEMNDLRDIMERYQAIFFLVSAQKRNEDMLVYYSKENIFLMDFMEENKMNLKGASVGIRQLGRAEAFLFVEYGVSHVFTPLMSRLAKEVLEANQIDFVAEKTIEYSCHEPNQEMCIFEQAVLHIHEKEIAYAIWALTQKQKEMKSLI